MTRMREHLTYANVMATIAVFIALGGTSYAAITITGRSPPASPPSFVPRLALCGRATNARALICK